MPSEAFDVPSKGTGFGVEPGELKVGATKNQNGDYRLEPGQQISLTMDFRNFGGKPIDTTIIIEALCDKASYKATDSFRVPGSTHSPPESKVVATWQGTATIPPDCKPLGISGVADGSLNAEVRLASGDPGPGPSSTVTFSVAD